MIHIKNGLKTYGNNIVLDKINIEVKHGHFVAIMGESGVGKSTLLNIIGFLDKLSDGEYFFEGIDVKNIPNKKKAVIRNKKIGFVFQDYCLLPNLTVYENVELPLLYFNHNQNYQGYIDGLLERLNIIKLRDHLVKNLSGGEKQRVSIARAIINDPLVLVCDEPTGNLDKKMSLEIFQILKELNDEGKTIILVTHNDYIGLMCPIVYEIKGGKVLKIK